MRARPAAKKAVLWVCQDEVRAMGLCEVHPDGGYGSHQGSLVGILRVIGEQYHPCGGGRAAVEGAGGGVEEIV
jgi:hypothetical protein